MDSLTVARFPFLSDAKVFADNHSVDVETLISSPSYEGARQRGLNRVLDAIRSSEVSYVPLTGSEFERVSEMVSYPYARILVSAICDKFLTKRYALAEAVRANKLLGQESPDAVVYVSRDLGVKAISDEGMLMMHFTDYLKYSSRMKSSEWKLVNSEVFKGNVFVSNDKFCRLLQNAVQDKIESELPLELPNEIKSAVKKDADHLEAVFSEMKKKFDPSSTGEISISEFPPCIRTLLAGTQNGVNLPHTGRFALVSFLHALGMNSEQILALFSRSPDFDESKSIYQIRHITGELSGQEYTPPECSTMKSYGICYEPDQLCNSDKINHPLTYYRVKTRRTAPTENVQKNN